MQAAQPHGSCEVSMLHKNSTWTTMALDAQTEDPRPIASALENSVAEKGSNNEPLKTAEDKLWSQVADDSNNSDFVDYMRFVVQKGKEVEELLISRYGPAAMELIAQAHQEPLSKTSETNKR